MVRGRRLQLQLDLGVTVEGRTRGGEVFADNAGAGADDDEVSRVTDRELTARADDGSIAGDRNATDVAELDGDNTASQNRNGEAGLDEAALNGVLVGLVDEKVAVFVIQSRGVERNTDDVAAVVRSSARTDLAGVLVCVVTNVRDGVAVRGAVSVGTSARRRVLVAVVRDGDELPVQAGRIQGEHVEHFSRTILSEGEKIAIGK